MFCDFCIKVGVSAEKKLSLLMDVHQCPCNQSGAHEASNAHVLATNKHVNEQKPSEAPSLKAKLSLNRVLFPKPQLLFHAAHAINIKEDLTVITHG